MQSEIEETAETSGSGSRKAYLLRRYGLIGLLTVILGTLEIWSNIGNGYTAGWGDHFVLSPEGISWAHPGAFANDWFMEAAPQPHWFFDFITFAGESLGILSFVYVLYWGFGLLAFATATTMLAFRFAPSAPWSVGIGVTLFAGMSSWMVGGTGSPVIAVALPAVLSANLIYLLIACFLTQRRVLAMVIAPLIAIVHVQQGSIAAVLLVGAIVAYFVIERRFDWRLAGALGLTGAAVAFGLILRPVASNLKDFVKICDQIIPYHCSAHLWGWQDLLSAVGLIVLCALTFVLMPPKQKPLWLATVGLAALGYTLGFLADALRIPFFGEIAQGVNVYRLGAVLLPFALWGAFVPFIGRMSRRASIPVLIIWIFGFGSLILGIGWAGNLKVRLVLFGLVAVGVVAWTMIQRRQGRHTHANIVSVAALSFGILLVLANALNGGMTVRAPEFEFIKDPNLRAWGENVREAVPVGEIIVASPRTEWVKLVTQRAVVVDCKDVPYGGEAWTQWNERLEDLGGWTQCVGPLLYDAMTAEQLVEAADKYGSDFISISAGVPQEVPADLVELGWTPVVEPVGTSGTTIYGRD